MHLCILCFCMHVVCCIYACFFVIRVLALVVIFCDFACIFVFCLLVCVVVFCVSAYVAGVEFCNPEWMKILTKYCAGKQPTVLTYHSGCIWQDLVSQANILCGVGRGGGATWGALPSSLPIVPVPVSIIVRGTVLVWLTVGQQAENMDG